MNHKECPREGRGKGSAPVDRTAYRSNRIQYVDKKIFYFQRPVFVCATNELTYSIINTMKGGGGS